MNENTTKRVKVSEIKPNPSNPRLIKDEKFKSLVKSIHDFPEMLDLRPIVVNADMIILGGNMRFKACKEAGLKEVPVTIAKGLTPEQEREFTIRDNVSGGDWDWEMLAQEWNADELEEWGLDLPKFEDTMTNNEEYEGLDQLSKLDKFMNAELKRMFLVYENEVFEKVVGWFSELQKKYGLENNSDVILKLMENEAV